MADTSAALERAREALAARIAAGLPARKDPIERLAAKPTSKALAIAAKCFDCVGGHSADRGWRRQVRECPSSKCPLFAVRPCQSASSDEGAEP